MDAQKQVKKFGLQKYKSHRHIPENVAPLLMGDNEEVNS